MKKIIITALNTRHTHSALALAYLKAFWEKEPTRQPLTLIEYDLNQTNEGIIADLILQKPDVIAFSVYIWSLSRTLVIAGALKAALPDTLIILGGPEVSFNAESIMQTNPCIDFVVRGEGEQTFTQLLEAILQNRSFSAIEGLTFKEQQQIIANQDRPLISDLDIIPSPFQTGIYKEVHSFTYYEASRGCPSKCSYCLSSVLGPVRNHSLDRVKADLDWFFVSNYRQVRFADRTFNFDRPRAREIISYIKANNKKNINFHFEIQADFLSEDIIDLLSDAPDGMFHLEIGIQSTNPDSLKAVNRYFDLEKLRDRITQLKLRTRCHLHLDLLGGLPYDTIDDFFHSLDDVWILEPQSIQISLVKVLRGTPLEKNLAEGLIFAMPEPPYTILRSKWLTGAEAIKIQDVGKLVEGMHNCQRFPASQKFIVKYLYAARASIFFASLSDYWRTKAIPFFNFSPENIAERLKDFLTAVPIEDLNKKNLVAKATDLLEHELRMTQKVPGGPPGPLPIFALPVSRHQYRPTPGLKTFWYTYDPEIVARDPAAALSGNFPKVYLFERDLSATPSIEPLNLSLAEAFTVGAIQLRVPIESLAATWESTYPLLPIPDFSEVIEKLCENELLYEPAKKRNPAVSSV